LDPKRPHARRPSPRRSARKCRLNQLGPPRCQDHRSDSSRPRCSQPESTLSAVEWVYHTDWLVDARAVDVWLRRAHHKLSHEVVIAIGFDRLTTSVFGNQVVAVIEVRGGAAIRLVPPGSGVAIDCLFDSPAGRVIFVGDGAPLCRIVART